DAAQRGGWGHVHPNVNLLNLHSRVADGGALPRLAEDRTGGPDVHLVDAVDVQPDVGSVVVQLDVGSDPNREVPAVQDGLLTRREVQRSGGPVWTGREVRPEVSVHSIGDQLETESA